MTEIFVYKNGYTITVDYYVFWLVFRWYFKIVFYTEKKTLYFNYYNKALIANKISSVKIEIRIEYQEILILRQLIFEMFSTEYIFHFKYGKNIAVYYEVIIKFQCFCSNFLCDIDYILHEVYKESHVLKRHYKRTVKWDSIFWHDAKVWLCHFRAILITVRFYGVTKILQNLVSRQ